MSLSHTAARKSACKKYGTRIASLPGVTREILKRAICLDYTALKREVNKVADLLTRGQKIEVKTVKGTHLTFSVGKRKGFADDGIYTTKGAFGNLPAGEACIGPLEETANGRLLVDGSCPFLGKLKKPIEIIIKNGYAQNIPLPQMKPLFKRYGRKILNVAELGIGLNPKAKITGNVLEDEKVQGTAHVALGNNKSFGGRVNCPCHLDFVFRSPSIIIDGRPLKLQR
jgi:leucyl aminopeptidase (aminopeptidase T)